MVYGVLGLFLSKLRLSHFSEIDALKLYFGNWLKHWKLLRDQKDNQKPSIEERQTIQSTKEK
jgi:hypothetical protein